MSVDPKRLLEKRLRSFSSHSFWHIVPHTKGLSIGV
ncbi:DEHA2E14278p [Debaryomyces hansenii CBS767]|uniref:DEHA2E14278p n=1 Tax=Debaryomyces hansenii (strain ATCC 36239 / CBS 767 / BCRC 21394 / JCM 1990 / NBRC 0083 / IGC 2968) TaxID=284592 RepID=Q6BPE4_DEBHA|nr:DEHA2E14278p [Debaryomyces hansenii CBS767]CAG88170.1 DEHA2E14278p [Debaryomyces hansenii CBS767]|eukprot:XP_459926.1 DEHA2E14278p [Debaryomyces hansenii CBS767]